MKNLREAVDAINYECNQKCTKLYRACVEKATTPEAEKVCLLEFIGCLKLCILNLEGLLEGK